MPSSLEIGFALDRRWYWMSELASILAAADLPYAIIGGVALQVHQAEPRTTLDIDLAVKRSHNSTACRSNQPPTRNQGGPIVKTRTLACSLLGLAFSAIASAQATPSSVPSSPPRWALAIHGGAGVIDKSMPEAKKAEYFASLERALKIGQAILAKGGAALDAVEAVVRDLENDPRFNAGKGAVFTHDGKHELDAAIMNGETLSCGAVAGLTTVKNPISLARAVMEKSPHVFLIGSGAESFASEVGAERVAPEYFDTPERKEQLEKALTEEKSGSVPKRYGTVGAVALDARGHLAAATSTGGMTNKRWGRVGDVPVIGAGTFAKDGVCAVSATGVGEQFIRHTVARTICARIEFGGLGLEAAAQKTIGELEVGDGGIVAVGADGAIAWVFNSKGMFRGAANSDGRFEVKIWE